MASLKCMDVSFKTMVQVMSVMGMWAAMISGVTTGALTALESNFNLSTFELGWIIVCYDIGAVCIATPCGYLGSRYPTRWIGAGFVFCSAAVALFGMVSNLFLFTILQVVAGAGGTIIWVLGCIHIDNNVQCKAVASDYTGWLMVLAPFGVIGGLMLAGSFLSGCTDASEGTNDCSSALNMTAPFAATPQMEGCDQWRYPFWILGVCLAPWGFWFFFSKKYYSTPTNATCCGTIENLPEGSWDHMHDEEATQSVQDFKQGVVALMTNTRFLLVTLGGIVHMFQSTAVIAFGPRYIEKQLCVRRSTASLLTGTLIPMISFGSYMGGYLPKRMGWGVGHSRKPMLMMAVTTGLSVPFTLIAFLFDDVGAFLLIISVSLTLQFTMSVPVVTSAQRVVFQKHRGLAVGLQSLLMRVIGAIPGPLVMGVLLDEDERPITPWRAYVLVSCTGCAVASLAWLAAFYLQQGYDAMAAQPELTEIRDVGVQSFPSVQPLLPSPAEASLEPRVIHHI
eukprot:TRINITY_DN4522_c0_g1_i1.p1 TRINITY_DN4522_c0_g1~~TRINITY_DN4522_c0_g1_i1.p1  ORF type:complete len:507 (+),score=70.38 TRINITY_DN4522_c0_g1_i1:472-1992(+)